MKHQLSGILATIAICAGLVGCKKNDPDAKVTADRTEGKSTLHPGWNSFTCAGMSISLPKNLPAIDLTSGDISRITDEVNKQFPKNPEVVKMFQQSVSNGGLKFMAIDPVPGSTGFRNNVNLLVLPVPASTTLDQLLELNKGQLVSMSVPGTVTGKQVNLTAGQADEMHADIDAGSQGGKRTMSCYLIIHSGQQFVFTFSYTIADRKEWDALSKTIMDTVRFD